MRSHTRRRRGEEYISSGNVSRARAQPRIGEGVEPRRTRGEDKKKKEIEEEQKKRLRDRDADARYESASTYFIFTEDDALISAIRPAQAARETFVHRVVFRARKF